MSWPFSPFRYVQILDLNLNCNSIEERQDNKRALRSAKHKRIPWFQSNRNQHEFVQICIIFKTQRILVKFKKIQINMGLFKYVCFSMCWLNQHSDVEESKNVLDFVLSIFSHISPFSYGWTWYFCSARRKVGFVPNARIAFGQRHTHLRLDTGYARNFFFSK